MNFAKDTEEEIITNYDTLTPEIQAKAYPQYLQVLSHIYVITLYFRMHILLTAFLLSLLLLLFMDTPFCW